MKNIVRLILVFTLVSHVVHSQDCDEYIWYEANSKTGEKVYSAHDFISIVKERDTTLQMLTMLMNAQRSLILSVYSMKKFCVDPSDEIHFSFSDGTKYKVTGNQDFNCDGSFSIYFGDVMKNNELLELLIAKKVSSLRLYCRAGTVDVTLSPQNSDQLSGEMSCLNALLRR